MKNLKVISGLVLITTGLAGGSSLAAKIDWKKIHGRLPTRLTPAEAAQELADEGRYPHFMKFLKDVDVTPGIVPTDPRNRKLIPSDYVFTPTQEIWNKFFTTAAEDHLTVLRAFALLSREVKKDGIVVFGPGRDFEKAVSDNHVDLGLALPAKNIGTAIWAPDPSITDPEFLLHLKVFYTKPYIHKFPDEILPANLKIGYGKQESYWLDGKEYTQHTIDADIYYGPTEGVGFRHVKGVGGQKRGVLGFFQKVLFFLPDAVDSMTINPSKDEMVTEALVNTTVDHFETNPIYSIKIVQKSQ